MGICRGGDGHPAALASVQNLMIIAPTRSILFTKAIREHDIDLPDARRFQFVAHILQHKTPDTTIRTRRERSSSIVKSTCQGYVNIDAMIFPRNGAARR